MAAHTSRTSFPRSFRSPLSDNRSRLTERGSAPAFAEGEGEPLPVGRIITFQKQTQPQSRLDETALGDLEGQRILADQAAVKEIVLAEMPDVEEFV